MDRSNILIGAGVLVGLGVIAYWYMNKGESAGEETSGGLTYAKLREFNVGPLTTPIKPVLPVDANRAIRQRSDAFERNY